MGIEHLIVDYMAEIARCLDLFEEGFGRRDLVRARREGAMPKEGNLPNGAAYSLHGFGCTVEYGCHDVNFDFGNRYEVGFDALSLWAYARQFPERYPDLQDRETVQQEMESLTIRKEIENIETPFAGEANSRLFRVKAGDHWIKYGRQYRFL